MDGSLHRFCEGNLGCVVGLYRISVIEAEPIIWTRNDWNRGFMNGSIGRLKVVKPQTNTATVELDGLDVELLSGDWSFVDLAA